MDPSSCTSSTRKLLRSVARAVSSVSVAVTTKPHDQMTERDENLFEFEKTPVNSKTTVTSSSLSSGTTALR